MSNGGCDNCVPSDSLSMFKWCLMRNAVEVKPRLANERCQSLDECTPAVGRAMSGQRFEKSRDYEGQGVEKVRQTSRLLEILRKEVSEELSGTEVEDPSKTEKHLN